MLIRFWDWSIFLFSKEFNSFLYSFPTGQDSRRMRPLMTLERNLCTTHYWIWVHNIALQEHWRSCLSSIIRLEIRSCFSYKRTLLFKIFFFNVFLHLMNGAFSFLKGCLTVRLPETAQLAFIRNKLGHIDWWKYTGIKYKHTRRERKVKRVSLFEIGKTQGVMTLTHFFPNTIYCTGNQLFFTNKRTSLIWNSPQKDRYQNCIKKEGEFMSSKRKK